MNTTTEIPQLPDLSDERIDEIERTLFARIANERGIQHGKGIRRRRLWIAGGAAAAVVAVAAVIAPSVGGIVRGTSGGEVIAVQPADSTAFELLPEGTVVGGSAESGSSGLELSAPDTARGPEESASDREIISTATANVTVEDVSESASMLGDAAVARGGYVESMNVGVTGSSSVVDPATGLALDSLVYVPTDGAWISMRVPSTELTGLLADLDQFGEVTASSINRQDVTDQAVDLDARISAAEASVDRLSELMAQAGDLSDLIAAESALSERQAALEALQQEREMLSEQVAMSSLTVTLSPVAENVEADPAGFGDGLVTGWNGLVATLNGIVVALGFLLPWIAVGAAAWFIVWTVVRLVKRRRARAYAGDEAPAEK